MFRAIHDCVMNVAYTEYGKVQSGNVPGWSELLIESSYTDSQYEKGDENGVSRVVSRRDMATQMSPESCPEPSPTYIPPLGSHHSARLEVRDVQVDIRVTMTKQSKRNKMRMKSNGSNIDKILNKHRAAQMKAQEMRRTMSESVTPRTSRKFRTLRKHVTNSLTGCFRCHDS